MTSEFYVQSIWFHIPSQKNKTCFRLWNSPNWLKICLSWRTATSKIQVQDLKPFVIGLFQISSLSIFYFNSHLQILKELKLWLQWYLHINYIMNIKIFGFYHLQFSFWLNGTFFLYYGTERTEVPHYLIPHFVIWFYHLTIFVFLR